MFGLDLQDLLTCNHGQKQNSNHVTRALDFLKQAKEEIQAKVKEQTSITLEKPDPTGHGRTSTMGNIV